MDAIHADDLAPMVSEPFNATRFAVLLKIAIVSDVVTFACICAFQKLRHASQNAFRMMA